MKTAIFSVLLGFCVFGFLGGCATPGPVDAAHHSHNSLDWAGVYTGRVPSASGMGIDTTLTLRGDSTYVLKEHYVGRSGAAFVSRGAFTWDKSGGVIRLEAEDAPRYYRVCENALQQLDITGKAIPGALAEHYLLQKRQR